MSGMPFSAVIVGVGDDEDFADMEELDADATVLRDSDGNMACRDIVQFVKYSDFKELGMRELALEVLGEVPDQFVDYQVMTKELPEMLYQHNPQARFEQEEASLVDRLQSDAIRVDNVEASPMKDDSKNKLNAGVRTGVPVQM